MSHSSKGTPMTTPELTEEDLLIVDVALNEFIWNLEEELDTWDNYDKMDDGFDRSDEEWNILHDMILDAENVSDTIQSMILLESEYV